MTNSESIGAPQPLGVGQIIGESFTLFFRHVLSVVLVAVLPTLVGLVLGGLLMGWGVALGTGDVDPENFSIWGLVAGLILQIVMAGVSTGLLVQLAYDAKLGRPIRLASYFGPAIAVVIPLTLLSFVAGIAAGLGFLLLVVPGLWVYAVFSMVPPAVVIERVGFGGLGRSIELTREYRWPIVGALIVMGILNWLINFVAVFVAGIFGGMAGLFGSIVVMSLVQALSYGLSGILVALIYARLRQIKEGTSVSDIAAVFD